MARHLRRPRRRPESQRREHPAAQRVRRHPLSLHVRAAAARQGALLQPSGAGPKHRRADHTHPRRVGRRLPHCRAGDARYDGMCLVQRGLQAAVRLGRSQLGPRGVALNCSTHPHHPIYTTPPHHFSHRLTSLRMN